MKARELNWQEQAQEEIHEVIKDMSREEEVAYWQEETARMRLRHPKPVDEDAVRQRLSALIKAQLNGRTVPTA